MGDDLTRGGDVMTHIDDIAFEYRKKLNFCPFCKSVGVETAFIEGAQVMKNLILKKIRRHHPQIQEKILDDIFITATNYDWDEYETMDGITEL